MAKIELTPQEEKELKGRGFVAKPATNVVSNRRSYWDPRLDDDGHVRGWTLPLPADTLRMNFYLRHGFKLEDPDGNTGPPLGYFLRRTPAISSPSEIGAGEGEIEQKGGSEGSGLQCPICSKIFSNNDSLIHHMIYHRSAKSKAKAKTRKPRRGGARMAPRKTESKQLKEEAT